MADLSKSQKDDDAQAVSEVFNLALKWLEVNRRNFSLTLAHDDAHRIQLVKPLGELVLAIELLYRRAPWRVRAHRMLCWAWEDLNRGDFLLEVLAARPDLMMVATILASFRAVGLHNRKLTRLILYLLSTRYARALQLPNWRMLDLRFAMARLKGRAGFPRHLIARMWSRRHPEPWLIDQDSAYALTHEIFYVTDFGRAPYLYPSATREYVALCLPAWLEIFHRKSDLDLFSELLMVCGCLRIDPPQDAFARVLAPLRKHGFLPSPTGGGSLLLRHGMTPHRKAFLVNYHTTLVGFMAALLA
jgi:hypothetical protein